MKYGFVYIWRDKKHKKYYVGRHWGTLDDGYICSSNNMRNNYNRRPQDFKRRILSYVYTSINDLVEEEQKWLNLISLRCDYSKYYNITFKSHSPSHRGFKHSEEAKRKIGLATSKALKGRKQTQEWLHLMKNRIQSKEEKEKRANKLRGLKRTDEFKKRMSKPKEKVLCPHCFVEGGLAVMKRWHFNNCINK